MTIKVKESCGFHCIFCSWSEETFGDGDNCSNHTKRPRYNIEFAAMLPFAPSEGSRIGGLFPQDAQLCYTGADPMDEDDDLMGWKADACFWCAKRRAFIIQLGVELMIPWESDPKKLPKAYPGWKFILNKEASEGFDRTLPLVGE